MREDEKKLQIKYLSEIMRVRMNKRFLKKEDRKPIQIIK